MASEIKPEVIKRTQELLGKHIKKPPLTEKLLRKPPFRFLHDVMTSVIIGTGFMDGVLTVKEMNPENITDRDTKIVFLQKIIDYVVASTGTPLSVLPKKIISGNEPTKTNELLQAIGKALDEKQKKTLQDVASPTQGLPKKVATKIMPIAKQSSSKLIPPKGNPSVTGITKPSKLKLQDRLKSKEVDKKKIFTKPTIDLKLKTSSQTKLKPAAPSKKKEDVPQPIANNSDVMGDQLEVKSSNEHEEADVVDEIADRTLDAEVTNDEILTFTDPDKQDDESLPPPVQELEMKRPPSAHFRQRKSSDSNVDPGHTKLDKSNHDMIVPLLGVESEQSSDKVPLRRPMSARPTTARPASARPAAPRVRDRGVVQPKDEPNLAVVSAVVPVITDNDASNNQEDEDDFLVIQSKPAIEDIEVEEIAQPLPIAQQGHLVAQILETQKEHEGDRRQDALNKSPAKKRVDIEWEGGRKRDREAVKQEVNKLRSTIQKATSVVNPLGKLMDFVQEDVDSMHRELEMWRDTNKKLTMQFREEQRLTDQAVEPMKLQLDQIEESIREKRDQISALKSTVIQNDNRIKQLLMGEVSSSR